MTTSKKVNISLNNSENMSVYGLSNHEIHELKQISQERYGKASLSLLVRKLLQEQIRQPEKNKDSDSATFNYQEKNIENKRLTLRLPPKHQAYISQKAALQHSSQNDIVRDIIAEHITQNPVVSNDAVQALYQSNYQLLRIGRNINQLARQFNAILPQSITTQQLNEIAEYLDFHTEIVCKVLKNQTKPFKYRESRSLDCFESQQAE